MNWLPESRETFSSKVSSGSSDSNEVSVLEGILLLMLRNVFLTSFRRPSTYGQLHIVFMVHANLKPGQAQTLLTLFCLMPRSCPSVVLSSGLERDAVSGGGRRKVGADSGVDDHLPPVSAATILG